MSGINAKGARTFLFSVVVAFFAGAAFVDLVTAFVAVAAFGFVAAFVLVVVVAALEVEALGAAVLEVEALDVEAVLGLVVAA